jgi:hypothetical protein
MNIREILRFPALVFGSIIIIVLFTSYGNKKVHPDLNTIMVERFLKSYKNAEFAQNAFKNYTFEFGSGIKLKGTAIRKDGLFSSGDPAVGILGLMATGAEYNDFFDVYSEEGTDVMSPKEWISHGGYAADVPEVPASLRHFYDPTQLPGNRYLTDIANVKVMGEIQKAFTNPRIDGVEWALGSPALTAPGVQDHQYTWERGKLWIQMALKETNKDKKDEFMAKAWRSLGETLHMIADNGCPAHVRNDAHPSPLWSKNDWFGNPDPYEEYIDIIRRDDPSTFINLANGIPNEKLKQQFIVQSQVRGIADVLATNTNQHFITNETISGIDKNGNTVKQITHPSAAYSMPLLQHMKYESSNYSYNTTDSVKQCVDHYWLAKIIPLWCDPFVDIECVKSQAKVLLPNIVEAGANAIKLFIPKLTIEIKSIENGVLKGEIRHKTDEEFRSEIKYTGEVTILVKDNDNKELRRVVSQAKDGIFEKENLTPQKEEKITATIEFGGVIVESEVYSLTGDEIFGVYEGSFQYEINHDGFLKYRLSSLNPGLTGDAREAGEIDARNMAEYDIQLIKNLIAPNQGQKIKLTITRFEWNDDSWDISGLKYIVINNNQQTLLPASFVPLKNKGQSNRSLVTSPHEFVFEESDSHGISYNLHVLVNNGIMTGNFSQNYGGNVMYSGSIEANKVK